MTARVLRFPARQSQAIFISREALGGWLVLRRDHGWIHGNRHDALADAAELARQDGVRVVEVAA